jgi:hypothetical protein
VFPRTGPGRPSPTAGGRTGVRDTIRTAPHSRPMNRWLGVLLGLGLISGAWAAESTNRLSFPKAGFSIQPLEAVLAKTPQMVLTMSLPLQDGFAGNVNVLIQTYTNSLAQYIQLSEAQFKAAGISLLKTTRPTESVAVLEYFGKLQNRVLHWYARAELVNQRLYLVTATTSEDRWSDEGATLKACVDSFKRDDK